MDAKVRAEVRVRFADVDAMGHVNNAHYFTYFEQARVEYFKLFHELNFVTMRDPPENSVILASIRCDFRSPAYLDEVLFVKIRARTLKRSSFVFEYEIEESTSGRVVAVGESVQVYFNYRDNKPLPLTPELRKRFGEIEGKDFGDGSLGQ